MAGDWIKMRTGLHEDPRVVQIASRCRHALGVTGVTLRTLVVGALHAVWSIADEHSIDGSLPGYSAEVLDELVGVDGFAAAMEAVGWLEIAPGGVKIADFERHNGAGGKRRATEARRQAKHRASRPERDERHAPAVTPCVAREEKRREEEPPQPPRGGGGDSLREWERAKATLHPELLEEPWAAILAPWEEHLRARLRRGAMTRPTALAALAELVAWGPQRVEAAIAHSIPGGFARLAEPPGAARPRPCGPQPRQEDERARKAREAATYVAAHLERTGELPANVSPELAAELRAGLPEELTAPAARAAAARWVHGYVRARLVGEPTPAPPESRPPAAAGRNGRTATLNGAPRRAGV